jgi:hypothetical protein
MTLPCHLHKGAEPTKQGFWSDQSGDLTKVPTADELGSASKPESLGVAKASGFAAQLFEQHTILLLEKLDHRLLVLIHPAGDGNKEELELSCHGVKESLKNRLRSILQINTAEFFGNTRHAPIARSH